MCDIKNGPPVRNLLTITEYDQQLKRTLSKLKLGTNELLLRNCLC